MGSITIHALDEALDIRLSQEARSAKKSKNRLVKDLLAQSLGLKIEGAFSDDYREFCGLWSDAEHEAFLASQADNSRIEAGDWL